jgi:two-component system sensor histidine kinase KdpD
MPPSSQTENRPSPEALLEEVQKERRGKLKIFLGAAPGVGKTYEKRMASMSPSATSKRTAAAKRMR